MKTMFKVLTIAVGAIAATATLAAEDSHTSPNGKPTGATGSSMKSGGGGGTEMPAGERGNNTPHGQPAGSTGGNNGANH